MRDEAQRQCPPRITKKALATYHNITIRLQSDILHIMDNSIVQVIIPANLPNPPEPHEVEVARIISKHYQQTIEFLKPIDDYKRKTPDFVMVGILWEIKSPQGKSRATIGRTLKKASKQSRNIIIDCRRMALPYEKIVSMLRFELSKRRQIKRVVLIAKNKEVVEIQ